MENFYYECLYDILREADPNGANLPALKHNKAKIIKLHSIRMQTSLLDTTEADKLAGERPTLFHLIQMQKRRTARTIRSLRDGNGFIQTSPNGIALAFTTFILSKYDNIEIDAECVRALVDIVGIERPRLTRILWRTPLTSAKYTRLFTLVGRTGSRVEMGLGSNSTRPRGQP